MSRTKSAILGTISSQLYSIIAIFISLFSVPIIVRHLNSEIYGLSIIIFQLTAYLGMFDFGLTAGIDRYLAGTREDTAENRILINRIISSSIIVYIGIAAIIVLTGVILAPYAYTLFHVQAKFNTEIRLVISIISVILGLQVILRAVTGIFFAHQRQLLSNSISFFINISNTIFIIIFVCLGYGLWSFIYSQMIVLVLNSVLSIYMLLKYYPYISISFKAFDWSLIKGMFSYGFALFLTGIAVQIIFQTDRVIIGSFVSLTAVAIYSFAARLPELSSQLVWKIIDNAFPGLIELSKKSDGIKLMRSTHNKIMGITLAFTTTLFWVVVLVSYPFIKLWVGEKFYAGADFIILVSYLYMVQLTFIHVTSICLNGMGIVRKLTVSALIEAAINLGLSLYLVSIYGIKGVIIATVAGGMLTSFWFIPYLAIRHLGATFYSYVFSVLKPVIVCSIFDYCIYLAVNKTFHNLNSWFLMIIYTAMVSLVFLLPVYFLNKRTILEVKDMFYLKKL